MSIVGRFGKFILSLRGYVLWIYVQLHNVYGQNIGENLWKFSIVCNSAVTIISGANIFVPSKRTNLSIRWTDLVFFKCT